MATERSFCAVVGDDEKSFPFSGSRTSAVELVEDLGVSFTPFFFNRLQRFYPSFEVAEAFSKVGLLLFFLLLHVVT